MSVALHADVVGANGVEALRVDDVLRGRPRDVLTARTVTFFAAYVPLGDLTGGEVVVYGVAAVAGGARGSVGVGLAIMRRPPVGTIGDMIGQPFAMLDVPLRGEREVVAAAFLKIALLPAAAIDECDLVECEGADRIRICKVAEHRAGMELRIANDIGHPGLPPAVVGCFVAWPASGRADECSRVVNAFLRMQSACDDDRGENQKRDM